MESKKFLIVHTQQRVFVIREEDGLFRFERPDLLNNQAAMAWIRRHNGHGVLEAVYNNQEEVGDSAGSADIPDREDEPPPADGGT